MLFNLGLNDRSHILDGGALSRLTMLRVGLHVLISLGNILLYGAARRVQLLESVILSTPGPVEDCHVD